MSQPDQLQQKLRSSREDLSSFAAFAIQAAGPSTTAFSTGACSPHHPRSQEREGVGGGRSEEEMFPSRMACFARTFPVPHGTKQSLSSTLLPTPLGLVAPTLLLLLLLLLNGWWRHPERLGLHRL